ncbi:hypothetical protein MtrunA17_Chr5g0401111 [Medicago truncatula]|uniref:Transmembrane protein, putative n=1 Tax=Medicago truncatula TaxID=3880 RepID=G7K2I3_MEDTR|nr:transmembrane protein, putative [Medicago truncatula]RHN53921.1 hypothetical protein MtrunA17_Chr5g0401111 [Medicago truncatula]
MFSRRQQRHEDFASDDIHILSKTLVDVTCNAATYMIIYIIVGRVSKPSPTLY